MSATQRLIAIIVVVATMPTLALTIAQNPPIFSQPFDSSEIPALEKITSDPVKRDRAAADRIRQQLQAAQAGGPADPTGDPVLDDVLQIIQQRGSILDGSSLDITEARASKNQTSQTARVAEMLLKASRHLERLGSLDDLQRDLVAQMRQESARLLKSK